MDGETDRMADPIRYPWDTPPDTGSAITVAEGILWLRLPLPMTLDHVNIYALDEGDHWTLVDCGIQSRKTMAIWDSLLAGPLRGKPVGRVLLTHHHPDHVGAAGWFMAQGAELWASRTAWTLARMLILDVETEPSPAALAYWRAAGMDPAIYARRLTERPFNFADMAHPLPVGYRRLQQGDVIRAAGRTWDVHVGHGHAPEHLVFFSRDDALVLAGDQILPSISPNIGVHPSEPLADPLADWLESCARFATLVREDHLILGGHKLPFTGAPTRMRQLIDNHAGGLKRLVRHLDVPRTAVECFPPLFKRTIDAGTYGLAMVEAVAHLNHLLHLGHVTRDMGPDGAWRWRNA